MRRNITAIALTAGVSGCVFADTDPYFDEEVGTSKQHFDKAKLESVPYPIQRSQSLPLPPSGEFPVVTSKLTGRPLSAWEGSHVELLIADTYAQCLNQMAGLEIPAAIGYEGYPNMAGSSVAMHQIQSRVRDHSCPLAEYVDGGVLTFPPAPIEWAKRRENRLCNADSSASLRRALVLPETDSASPVVDFANWMSLTTPRGFSFDADPARRLYTESKAYDTVHRGFVNLCVGQALASRLESADTLQLTTQELLLLMGVQHELAQSAMIKLGYLLKINDRASSSTDVPANNFDGAAVGAYLWHWMNETSSSVRARLGTAFATAVRLVASSSTAFASYLERQAGARWTSSSVGDAYSRDWGTGSARGRLMNLIFGGYSALGDYWGEVEWLSQWFSPIRGMGDDPRTMVMLQLARAGNALYLRELASDPRGVDPLSAEEIYLETEAHLRKLRCVGDEAACSDASIRATLPPLIDRTAFVLYQEYQLGLEHAQQLATGLFDAVVKHDMLHDGISGGGNWTSGHGAFHMSGTHARVDRTDHTGAFGSWIRLDPLGSLVQTDYADKIEAGASMRGPRLVDWHEPFGESLYADDELHEAIGVVPAFAFAREVLYDSSCSSKSLLEPTVAEALRAEVERLVGDKVVLHRPTSIDAIVPATSVATVAPELLLLSGKLGDKGVKAAARLPGYSSPTGISRAELDARVDGVAPGDAPGCGAFASYRNLSWTPATPDARWPIGTSLVLRQSSGTRTDYQYLVTIDKVRGLEGWWQTSAIVSNGWFADLERRITTVQDTNWSRPQYDGFGLPSNWVPPADASLMGGSAGEESYQYLLRSARAAAEEATAAVKTAIDKLSEEATDAAALDAAERRAEVLGGMEVEALCGKTAACSLPTMTVHFSDLSGRVPCNAVTAGDSRTLCEKALKRYMSELPPMEIPTVVSQLLESSSAVFAESEYAGSELQSALVRVWTAARLLVDAREQGVQLAIALGKEDESLRANVAAALAAYNSAIAGIETLIDSYGANLDLQLALSENAVYAANGVVEDKAELMRKYCYPVYKICGEWCAEPKTYRGQSYCAKKGEKCYSIADDAMTHDVLANAAWRDLVWDGVVAQGDLTVKSEADACIAAVNAYKDAVVQHDTAVANSNAVVVHLGKPGSAENDIANSKAKQREAASAQYDAAKLQSASSVAQTSVQLGAHKGIIHQTVGELGAALAALKQLKLRAVQSAARGQFESDAVASATKLNAELIRKYRSYDKWRAEALLDSARRFAVAARRSIEARFVVDLSTLSAEQAFVASPSTWADEIYESDLNAPEVVGLYRATNVSDDQIYPNKLLDYVGNLERFVQGYTMTYPTSVSLPDTEVITLGAPDQLERDASGQARAVSVDSSGWRFYCAHDKSWIAHPAMGQYGNLQGLDTACGGRAPSLAKIGFWLDPWGMMNGAWPRPQYADRHNVRWRRLAVNLVGTGIRDCTRSTDSMGCYTNPYIRFDLIHAGASWQTNHSGEWRSLDIPTAHVEGGKALAAEEWLEPVSNSWNMPYVANVARGELFGRPAAGNYELVLEITPDVRLDRIERIQLLVEQDYWVRQTGGRGVYDVSPRLPTTGSAGAPSTTIPSVGGASGSGGSGSGGASTGSGGTTSSSSTSYTGECTPYGTDLGIENFEDGNKIVGANARRLGAWYGFHAGTCSASPPTVSSFAPTSGLLSNGTNFIGHTDGTGCTFTGTPSWSGGGIGFNFLSSYVNGIETVCANYNASSYTGIAFDAQGSGQIRLEVCTSDHADPNNADCHGAYFTISSTWTRYQARWVNLSQRGWGTAVTFNSSHLRKLQFLSTDANYSFNVDNISFINN